MSGEGEPAGVLEWPVIILRDTVNADLPRGQGASVRDRDEPAAFLRDRSQSHTAVMFH